MEIGYILFQPLQDHCVKQTFAQEGDWNTGYGWLDDFFEQTNYNPGTYFYFDGNWTYCPDCAAHVNMEEIIVYGTDLSNFGINAPDLTGTGTDMVHYEPIANEWNWWDYYYEIWTPVPVVNHIITNNPPITQAYTNWCMYAVAEFLADIFSCASSDQEDYAANYLNIANGSGTPPNTAASWSTFLSTYYTTSQFYASWPPTEQDIKGAIDSGTPVLMRTWGGSIYHNWVIVGYQNGSYIVMDPATTNTTISPTSLNTYLNASGTAVQGVTVMINCPPNYIP